VVAADPAVSTTAQNVTVAQLMSAAATVPSDSTGWGADQVPDCHTETEPSDRATRHRLEVAHDTEKVSVAESGIAWAGDHVDPFHTMACPVRSTAMQNFGVGHDTEWSSDWPGEACRVQVVPS